MSGSPERCEDVIDRLTATLRDGGDVSDEDRRHVAACDRCRRLLATARQLEDELERDIPAGDSEERLTRVTGEAQAALRADRWRRTGFTILAAFAVLIPALMTPKLKILQGIGALVGLGAVGSLIVHGVNARNSSVKLYKRLKAQWIFGVCRGLAEAAGLSVWLLRVPFLLLPFTGKIGALISLSLYLLLDMSLEVHPEDRALLLRFKLRRWVKRHRAHA